MHSILLENRDTIASLCRRYHVQRLDVFGSAAAGGFDSERSDIDLLVEFEADFLRGRFDAYFGLLDELRQLLGREVDLVEPGGIRNRVVRAGIEQTREPLYAA